MIQARSKSARSIGTMLVLALAAGCTGVPVRTPGTEPSNASPAPRQSPGGTASGPSSPASTAGLAHYEVSDIGFDYPASWAVRPSDADFHYSKALAFVGTAPSSAACAFAPDSGPCFIDYALGAGQVSIMIESSDGPPHADPLARAKNPPAGTSIVSIDGVPGFLTDPMQGEAAGATYESWLEVPDLTYTIASTTLHAAIRGPGEEPLIAQVRALFESIHYEPAIRPTDQATGDAAEFATAKAMAALKSNDPAYDCFPTMPGTSRKDVIRQLPMHSPLMKDLPVTCSTTTEGTPLELWRMTLTIAWTVAGDRSAGSSITTVWVSLEGQAGETSSSASKNPPYWPAR
jgi:hypothetical protein